MIRRHRRLQLGKHFRAEVQFVAEGNSVLEGPVPLRTLAALVGCFRVHTGVHYSADVLAGALTGTTVAQLTTHALHRFTRRA